MAHDDNRLPCAQWRARADNMLDERASPRAVQNLCKAGFHPRAFSGSENYDSEIVVGHGFQPILREPHGFRNQGMLGTERMPNQSRGQE